MLLTDLVRGTAAATFWSWRSDLRNENMPCGQLCNVDGSASDRLGVIIRTGNSLLGPDRTGLAGWLAARAGLDSEVQ